MADSGIKTIVPYEESLVFQKLQKSQQENQSLRLAFLDIDTSWTGTPEEQVSLRQELEKQGYVIVFVTARASELCMSWAEREKSSSAVKKRPPAKLTHDPQTGKLTEIDPVELPSMAGLLDADIITASSGAELLIRQQAGGYGYDEKYASFLNFGSDQWRHYTTQLLKKIEAVTGKPVGTLHEIENIQNYHAGKTDITPLPYRVQIIFKNTEERNVFIATLKKLQADSPADSTAEFKAMLDASHIIDESNPYATPPYFSIYLVPVGLSKAAPVNRIMQIVTESLALPTEKIETLFSGDSPADLSMGLTGAVGTNATFIVVGGARLTRYIKENKTEFLEPEFQDIGNKLESVGAGRYTYTPTGRNVIIGDEAFPGTTGPQTILAWLNR